MNPGNTLARSFVGECVGCGWVLGDVTLANGVSGAWWTRKRKAGGRKNCLASIQIFPVFFLDYLTLENGTNRLSRNVHSSHFQYVVSWKSRIETGECSSAGWSTHSTNTWDSQQATPGKYIGMGILLFGIANMDFTTTPGHDPQTVPSTFETHNVCT